MKATKHKYELYLNYFPLNETVRFIDGRVPLKYFLRYGTWLRRHDPIAFNVGYNEFMRGEHHVNPIIY